MAEAAPARLVATRYTRGVAVAVVVIVALWHGLNDVAATLGEWAGYRWPAVMAADWALFALLAAYASTRLLRADGAGAAAWPVAVPLLAVSAAGDLACHPGQLLSFANWPWGAVGWVALMLFWRSRPVHLLLFLAANAAAMLTVITLDGQLTRGALARYLMVVFGTGALQVGLAGTVVALRAAADWTALAAQRARAADLAREAAEQAHRTRRHRYEVLRRGAAGVLREVAAGADPADPRLRRAAALEAARLRRLVVETDDVPDPLLHELRAAADVAERAGVLVEFATSGTVPPLPLPVRRALCEAPTALLAAARLRARVTVTGDPDEVVVAVVADAPDGPEADSGAPWPPAAPAAAVGVLVSADQEGDQRWVEASVRVAHDPR